MADVNIVTTGAPLNPVGAKVLAIDAIGTPGFVNKYSGGRKTLLIAGNSIALGSCRSVLHASSVTTTITATAVPANALALTLVAGGAATIGIVSGNTIGVILSGGIPWKVKATDVTGEVVTLEKPLPRSLLASASVYKITDTQGMWPMIMTGTAGFIRCLNSLCGAPYDILPGYGHGGGTSKDVVTALPAMLAYYNPDAVWLQMAENDIMTIDQQQTIDNIYHAASICLKQGAIPIVSACVPSSSITAAKASVFDAVNAAIMTIANTIPGSVAVDPGALYLDTSNSSFPRSPLAGWTDGVHPIQAKGYPIALGIKAAMDRYFTPSIPAYMLLGKNVRLSGTGGTDVGGRLEAGSVIATNIDVSSSVGITCSASKDTNDYQVIDFIIPGASNWGSQNVSLTNNVVPLPASVGPNMWVKGVAEIEITSMVNISDIVVSVQYVNTYCQHFTTNEFEPGALNGKVITIETPPAIVGGTFAYLSVKVFIKPKTLASPSGVSFSGKIKKLGLAIVPQGEMPI